MDPDIGVVDLRQVLCRQTHVERTNFCEFFAYDGVARVAERDRAPFVEVMRITLAKQRREAEAIREARRILFPERPEEAFQPLYSRH